MLVFFLMLLAGLELRCSPFRALLLSPIDGTPPPPRPPALSPPVPPRGLAQPSHYTFTALSVLPDFVTVALAQARVVKKIRSVPYIQRDAHRNIARALRDLWEPTGDLAAWLNWEARPAISVESKQSVQALRDMRNTCSAAQANSSDLPDIRYKWSARHASSALQDALRGHERHFEEYLWAFQPDEDDLGEYDDMELVGEVNRYEATNLNRSAPVFLATLHSTLLPELLDFRSLPASWTPSSPRFRDDLAKLKSGVDKLAQQVEQLSSMDWIEAAKPGLDAHGVLRAQQPNPFRRALLWARGKRWDYPCRQRAKFDGQTQSDGDTSPANDERHRIHSHDLFDRTYLSPDNYYYPAGVWRCILTTHRTVREKVLPMVRQAQAEVTEAVALYDTAVVEAGEKLLAQVGELLAGRGWEVVEDAEIGMTQDHHLTEVSRAKPGSLSDVRNVTLWRRMVMPLGRGAMTRLEWGVGQIARL
jgi:hypothetical protein